MAQLNAPDASINVPTAPKSNGSKDPTGAGLTVLGWIVLLVALYGANHTKIGHEMIFYSLCLIVLFLFTANYQTIQSLLFKGGTSS